MKSHDDPARQQRRGFAAPPLSTEENAELQRAAGQNVRVLRVARDEDVIVVASPEALAIRTGNGWHFRRWETILYGGWRDGSDQLYWTLLDGTEEHVPLAQPADMPFVFADRLRASIITVRQVELPDDLGSIILAGRRPPTDLDAQIVWTVQPGPGTDLNDARVQEHAVAEMAKLRDEFE